MIYNMDNNVVAAFNMLIHSFFFNLRYCVKCHNCSNTQILLMILDFFILLDKWVVLQWWPYILW